MADSEKELFSLDLDNAEALKKLFETKEAIGSLSESKHLDGLISGLGKVTALVGIMGAAFFAVKEALNLELEAESIKSVNAQFEQLTENAGLSGEALKESLEKASNGLIGEHELIQAANKALIEMGSNAKNLGPLMEIARKSTAAFGGDLLHNFEALNQAVATGQTRGLRHLGIVINQDQAMINYAKSIGTTVNALTDSDKKQAILNATLEKGKSAFANIDQSIKEATTSWQQLKATISNISEAFAIAFDKVFGSTVKAALKSLNEFAGVIKNMTLSQFGDEHEKAAIKVKQLTHEIDEQKKYLTAYQEGLAHSGGDKVWLENREKLIVKTKEHIAELEKELALHQVKAPGAIVTGDKSDEEIEKAKLANQKKIEAATQAELKIAQMKWARLQDEQKVADSIAEIDRISADKKLAIENEASAKFQLLDVQKELAQITGGQYEASRAELAASTNARIKELDDELLQSRIKSQEKLLEHATSSETQASAVAMKSALSAQQAWVKSGGVAGTAVTSFTSKWTDGFKQVGAGSLSVADAVKGAFLGSLGDMASAKGQFMILESFATFPAINLPELAAGTALVALGGFLGGKAGPGGAGTPSAGGGGSAASSTAASEVSGAGSSVQQAEAQKKTVNINVAGHYFETEQTKMSLVQMVREATDATDFNIKQIGER